MTNRTVVVTGGTGTLGGAIARGFRDTGARVIALGAFDEEVEKAAADPAFHDIETGALDVRDNDAVLALVGGLDRLDVLVNAGGIAASPADLTVEGFERTIDINLLGTVRTCYAAEALLRASKGSVINIGSLMSFRGTPTGPAYAAAKSGVKLLTASLAAAWAPDIRVNAIAPGMMESPMTVGMRADVERNARISARIPAGRWGTGEDLVGAALFLAGEGAAYVTGVTLPVDGGYLTT